MVPDVNTNGEFGPYPRSQVIYKPHNSDVFARLRLTRTTKNTIHEIHVHVEHINNIILSIFRTEKLNLRTNSRKH